MIYLKQIIICDEKDNSRIVVKFSDEKTFESLKEARKYSFDLEQLLPGKRIYESTIEK